MKTFEKGQYELRINNLQKQITALKEEFIQSEKEWPQDGDETWKTMFNTSVRTMWYDLAQDHFEMALGITHKTYEEAEVARDKILLKADILKMLDELNGDWKADWRGGKSNYTLIYDHEFKSVVIDGEGLMQSSKYVAKSKEVWEQILDKFGEQEVAECLGVI